MRHLKRTAKLGRTGSHRNAMLANLVCSLILHKRVTTTLAKAKAARIVAEKMMTKARKSVIARDAAAVAVGAEEKRKLVAESVHLRRIAVAELHQQKPVKMLFNELATAAKERRGGYTRIIRLGVRQGDVAKMVILEWVDSVDAPAAAPVAKDDAKTQAATA
jgi:large subunit ribosomal protein L17